MLLDQGKKEWIVFYKTEDEEDSSSEPMDKRTALDYLTIFHEAVYITNEKETIFKHDEMKHIKKEASKKQLAPILFCVTIVIIFFILVLLV